MGRAVVELGSDDCQVTNSSDSRRMGRSKAFTPLSKAERKRVKNGAPLEDNINQTGYVTLSKPRDIAYTHGRASTRGHSQTSNNWVHAVLFVVLVVIVVSWALGY